MIIALTAEEELPAELQTIHQLFDHGLDLLHLRKYHFTDTQMCRYVASIDATYRHKLVLHSHPHLAEQLQIYRIHLNECNRQNRLAESSINSCIFSTSVHHIDQFNKLNSSWRYALLSPLFPSISKSGYGQHSAIFEQLEQRSNFNVGLIGLGGIKNDNCLLPLQAGADGIALLGAVWMQANPLQNFIQCKQTLSKNYNTFHKDIH